MENQNLTQQLDAINEYEQEKIPENKLKGPRSFLGMYAGEHTAGTEFVIGPLFVKHGVTAPDLFIGLVFGNLLAVLSWAFITSPIAVNKRLTLYWHLRKICGPHLVLIYNLVNALMFCFLAGAMIAVASTAVGIPFDITMPALNDWLPTSVGWVVTVLIVGSVITIVAILGYDEVSRFANICAPWMILVFIAAAVAVLPKLGVESWSDFWTVANEKIWTGEVAEGQSKFTIWHVTFFAWFANLAMHIGMADLSILRYARKWQYGFSSLTGMFLGHYVAWIASGILCAAAAGAIAPGIIAYESAGIAGAFCVIIAGWTTSNPTIYRAGLAVQAVVPSAKRWKVTLFVGLVTTIGACFPALVMNLLDFVALYGLILMPMGAVIFMDHYLIPKMGLKPDYAAYMGINFNMSAALTWALTLVFCLILNQTTGLEIFFLGLPGWFAASIIYLMASKLLQRKMAPVAQTSTS